jgi:uncharacterized membrane protein
MIEPGLIQNAAAVGAAFAASLVECVEALTIVLVVSSVSGWRSGLLGAACGAVLLAAMVALAGGAFIRVPLNDLHVLVGVVLLVFGLSWLRKAVLRTAGIKAQRDEAATYSKQTRPDAIEFACRLWRRPGLSGDDRGLQSGGH